ncbi:hypothetical protein DPEC_G00227090 [Dallia pectoralis]|uniref:Uncharacterized protein n=1 Tax=Dallia pectoralis TaxID=75939 RepID=A0ACC2G0W0_DALPE|nr:hypothetical protein DPEC_G00227090 [Dallia pectoralis]
MFWVNPNAQLRLVCAGPRDSVVTRVPGTRQEEDKQNKRKRTAAWTPLTWVYYCRDRNKRKAKHGTKLSHDFFNDTKHKRRTDYQEALTFPQEQRLCH